MGTKTLVTAADLERLDGDGFRYELIAGELIKMSPAKPTHGWLGMRFGTWLTTFVETHQLGAVFDSSVGYQFAVDPDTVLEPDVSFIRIDRLPPAEDWDSFFRVAPDLALEVRPPSERKSYIDRKVRIYLAGGAKLILLADPRRRRIVVHPAGQSHIILQETDHFDAGDVVPGFRFLVADLFAHPAWFARPRRRIRNHTNGASKANGAH